MTPTDATKKKTKSTASKQTCPGCGTDNPADSQFCGQCATPLKDTRGGTVAASQTIRASTVELARGNRLAGRYEIIEELGQGGMGKVFRVYDHKIGEIIALKLIRPEIGAQDKAIERFKNELKFTRRITHRNICRMYDLGDVEFIHYITMEYVAGEDLKRFIKRAGPLSPGKAVAIAMQVCDGLAEAHRIGAVHRDLKSPNIMIDRDGNAKIMDFGIARFTDMDRMTGSGVMIGTPEYMSPEQVDMKEVDPRADIYSLGVVIYEMLAGKVPFEGETAIGLAMKHKMEKPRDVREWNPQIPAGLAAIVDKCLEKERDKRFQTAEELKAALQTVARECATGERPVPLTPATPIPIPPASVPVSADAASTRRSNKKIPAAAIAALAVIAVVAVILFVVKPGAGPAPTTPADSSSQVQNAPPIDSKPVAPVESAKIPPAKTKTETASVKTPPESGLKTVPATKEKSSVPKPPPQGVKTDAAKSEAEKQAEKAKPEAPGVVGFDIPTTEAQVSLARMRLIDPKEKAVKKGIDPKSLFFAAAEAREKEAQRYADQKKNAEARCLFTITEKLYRLCLDESKDAGRLRALSKYAADLRDQAREAMSAAPREDLFGKAADLLTEGELARSNEASERAMRALTQAAFEFEKIRWAGQVAKKK